MKKKTQILIIHGGMTFKNKKDYINWLKTRKIRIEKKARWDAGYLEEKLGSNFQIIRPRMPQSDDAKYEEWKIYFERFLPYIKKGIIFFFDINGDPVPKEIATLCNRIIQQAQALAIKLTFKQNAPMEHQYENTECGMYSLYFIIGMVTDKHDYTYFMKHRIPDENMKQMRLKYFTVG